MSTHDDSDQRYGAVRRPQSSDGDDSPVSEPVSRLPGADLSNPFQQLPRVIAGYTAPNLRKRAKQRYRSIIRTTVRTISTVIGRAIYPGSSRPTGRGGVEPTEYADCHGISSATTMHGFIARAKEATDDAQFSDTSDETDSRDGDHYEVTPREFAQVFAGLPGGGVIFEDVSGSSGAWIRADQVEDLEGWC